MFLYKIKSKNDFLDVKEENVLFLGILLQEENVICCLRLKKTLEFVI
jgi:hypothetical protein